MSHPTREDFIKLYNLTSIPLRQTAEIASTVIDDDTLKFVANDFLSALEGFEGYLEQIGLDRPAQVVTTDV